MAEASKEADNRRPAGSGADGRWTVEDEKAAFKHLKKNDNLGTEPYDVLADRLVKAKYFSEGLREETTRKRIAEALTAYRPHRSPYRPHRSSLTR